ALQHRDVFAGASIWSGYFLANTPDVEPDGSAAWRRDSPLVAVPRMAPNLRQKPVALSFYVGRVDRFAPQNVAFDRLLHRLGVEHRFALAPGGHTWSVWRDHLPAELIWLGRLLAVAPSPRLQ